jgi:hypothetical protein
MIRNIDREAEPPLIFGRQMGASIRSVLEAFPDVVGAAPFALVSSLDSTDTTALTTVAREILQLNEATTVSLVPLVFTGAGLIEWSSEVRPFHGFDELWLFADLPPRSVAHAVSLLAPVEVDRGLSPETAAWMRRSACLLGLGDGYGLNFVAADKFLTTRLAFHP